MSGVRKKAEALRDENERLARLAEAEMFNPELTWDQRQEASDRAKVYWQLRSNWADTVANAADAYPRKFTGRNLGTQEKTTTRKAYLRDLAGRLATDNYEAIAAAVMEDEAAGDLWHDKDGEELRKEALNFLKKHKPLRT